MALLTRTFVSSAGLDINPCTIKQPCVNATAGSVAMTLDNDEISYNSYGIYNTRNSAIVLGRSTITNNSTYGVENFSTIDTFLNNQISGNGNSNAVGGTALTTVSLQ